MHQATSPIPQACIFPRFEHIELLMGQRPFLNLPMALAAFEEGYDFFCLTSVPSLTTKQCSFHALQHCLNFRP